MDPRSDNAKEAAERAPTPEDRAALQEQVGEMAGYVNLLEAHDQALGEKMRAERERAEADATTDLDRMRAGARVESRWNAIRQPVWWAIGVLLVGILIAVIAFYGGRDDATPSADGSREVGELPAAPGSGETDAATDLTPAVETAQPGLLAGTWTVQADPMLGFVYELTFQPNGAALFLTPPGFVSSSTSMVIDSWSYTQEDSSVEIEIAQRIVDPTCGIDEPMNIRVHMTLEDGVMTGTTDMDFFVYDTSCEYPGVVYSGEPWVGPASAAPKTEVN